MLKYCVKKRCFIGEKQLKRTGPGSGQSISQAWSCLAPKELGGEVPCDDWLRSTIVDWLLLCVSSDCFFSFQNMHGQSVDKRTSEASTAYSRNTVVLFSTP
jgi:hypothetical protein